MTIDRPTFLVRTRDVPEQVHRYPQSEEAMGPIRRIGKAANWWADAPARPLGPHDGRPDEPAGVDASAAAPLNGRGSGSPRA